MRFIKQSTALLAICGFTLLSACTSITDLKTDLSERVFGREVVDIEPLTEFEANATAKVVWQAKLGISGNYDLAPVVEAGFAYAASSDGDLVKLDATNGKQLWHAKVTEKLTGGVGVGGSLVLVGTQKGCGLCL